MRDRPSELERDRVEGRVTAGLSEMLREEQEEAGYVAVAVVATGSGRSIGDQCRGSDGARWTGDGRRA